MIDLSCSICKELGETCSECQPAIDVPPATGHAIPMWLRWHFDELELHATHMSGASVFTQMRTKVQAYFEMLRAVERGNAGIELFLTGRAAESIVSPVAVSLPFTQDDGAEGRGYNKALRDCAASLEVAGIPFSNDPRIIK